MKTPAAAFLTLVPLAFGVLLSQACAQPAEEGLYACDGCEAIHERPFDDLRGYTVIPPEGEPGEPLLLQGTVYEPDGEKPAPGVVLYAYHTDAQGVYPKRGDETGWARRQGYLRGWVKTDAEGRYQFQTIRPASYPGRSSAAHVHMVVKEPDHPEYWIDDVVFEDDPFVTPEYRQRAQNRGGSGIIGLTRGEGGTWQGTRDIVLERHPN